MAEPQNWNKFLHQTLYFSLFGDYNKNCKCKSDIFFAIKDTPLTGSFNVFTIFNVSFLTTTPAKQFNIQKRGNSIFNGDSMRIYHQLTSKCFLVIQFRHFIPHYQGNLAIY